MLRVKLYTAARAYFCVHSGIHCLRAGIIKHMIFACKHVHTVTFNKRYLFYDSRRLVVHFQLPTSVSVFDRLHGLIFHDHVVGKRHSRRPHFPQRRDDACMAKIIVNSALVDIYSQRKQTEHENALASYMSWCFPPYESRGKPSTVCIWGRLSAHSSMKFTSSIAQGNSPSPPRTQTSCFVT